MTKLFVIGGPEGGSHMEIEDGRRRIKVALREPLYRKYPGEVVPLEMVYRVHDTQIDGQPISFLIPENMTWLKAFNELLESYQVSMGYNT